MASAKKTAARKDPTPRFLGSMPFFELENADATRRYVWANGGLAINPGGPGWFELQGYVVETIQPGGVRPRGIRIVKEGDKGRTGLKDGDEIKVGDLYLMSIDRAEHEAQVEYAQRQADVSERKMIKNRGIPDALRGIHSKYYRVSGEVSPLQRDFGGE